MTRLLLILWMGLIGAERLDLDGGATAVTVTPFLLLTPVLVAALLTERRLEGRAVWGGRSTLWFALLTSVLLFCIGASAYASLDADTTLMRATLAFIQIGGAALVALLVHDNTEALQALRAGATLGVALFIVTDVLAVLAFLGLLPMELNIGPSVLRFDSYGYAGLIPRMSGTTLDPNAGGLLLVIFALLEPRVRWVAGILLVTTLSRSAIAAGAVVAVIGATSQGIGRMRAPVRGGLVVTLLLAALLVAVGRSPQIAEHLGRTLAPFAERFGMGENAGSATEHGALVVRAVDEGSKSVQRVALGLGWGASHRVLQDFWPGNRYGNFHSLYGTAFAETGVISLVALLFLLLGPLFRKTRYQPLVAGFIVFNLFYQATTVPAFWLLLALAWVTVESLPSQPGEIAPWTVA
ncbi:MAG: hypothetical protein ACYC7F_00725 [Gemmatimonadaceae bacterium]